MPSKYYDRNFRPQNFYHIFNRGAYKNRVFLDKSDYEVFVEILAYYLKFPKTRHFAYQKKVNEFQVRNLEETVHLAAYCLMPNHFHLLLKQLPSATKKTGISNLMRRLSIAYAMYFQNKYKHTGTLFQGKFKNVTVDSDEQLLHLSRYIHLNPDKLSSPHSSYSAYVNDVKLPKWLHLEYVLGLQKDYKNFIETPMSEEESESIKPLVLE